MPLAGGGIHMIPAAWRGVTVALLTERSWSRTEEITEEMAIGKISVNHSWRKTTHPMSASRYDGCALQSNEQTNQQLKI